MVLGRRPNGIYVPRFRNVKTKHAGFLRGYGFQGGGHRRRLGARNRANGIRPGIQEVDQSAGTVAILFGGYGECLPNHDNYVELDKEKVDAWGIPVLKINCAFGENELALRKDMSITAAEMLAAAGAHDIEPLPTTNRPDFPSMRWARLAWGATRRLPSSIPTIKRTMSRIFSSPMAAPWFHRPA